ncbi:hypothetical protein VIGAN_01285300 [Vigna angularis var. angularis]|uniref:Uncharacterized protein n=1 Tax=Vigna angularis var. angularis TaxID=157739 RepID=A0A0S3R388_PHAAN|nr:hypothetical protein VIGAN_01285300 [Vigna angularis var. angularis]
MPRLEFLLGSYLKFVKLQSFMKQMHVALMKRLVVELMKHLELEVRRRLKLGETKRLKFVLIVDLKKKVMVMQFNTP